MLKNYLLKGVIEAGCDEAGRGCLAGPVVAAAVILPKSFSLPFLDDSKKLTSKRRDILRAEIEFKALAFGVAFVDHTEIDEINILNASIEAMHRALDKLSLTPKHIIIDGNRFKPYRDIEYQTVVKGDSKYASIAAASILAKTYRDDYMRELHELYPDYGWDSSMGYPTAKHRAAVSKLGPTPYHRLSFKMK